MQNYFLGIRLPGNLEREIEAWRRRFRAPQTVPHITLVPPFQWSATQIDLLHVVTQSSASSLDFAIRGSGIGSFGRAVLFVNVELSHELKSLQETLANALAQYGVARDQRSYHPHITLA